MRGACISSAHFRCSSAILTQLPSYLGIHLTAGFSTSNSLIRIHSTEACAYFLRKNTYTEHENPSSTPQFVMSAIGIKRKRDVGVSPEAAEKKRSARITKVILYPTKTDAAKAAAVMMVSHQDDEPTTIPRPSSVDIQGETTYTNSLPDPAAASQAATIHNSNTGCHTPQQQHQALALIASHPRATAFDKRVWRLLVQIPRGRVSTYGALAAHLASSPRAVGNALRRNPFAPLVPCHRVVAAGGALGGFKGKVARRDGEDATTLREKRALLRGEGVGLDGVGGRVLGTPWDAFVG